MTCACTSPTDPSREHPRTWLSGAPACRFSTSPEQAPAHILRARIVTLRNGRRLTSYQELNP